MNDQDLCLGTVMGGMRCTPLVTEWSNASLWLAPMVFLWDQIDMRER